MTKITKRINAFINDYVEALLGNRAAVFVGAGMSHSCGYCDWKGLMKPIAEELELDIESVADLTELAQWYVDDCGVKNHLNQKVVSAFMKNVTLSENHRTLASLPIRTYWTTNFDHLIEKALSEAGKTVDKKVTNIDFTCSPSCYDAKVYKMNGDMEQLDTVVLTKSDFEEYSEKRRLFNDAFKADFMSHLFLFIGVSFNDPNMWNILTKIRNNVGKYMKRAYYFVRKEDSCKSLWINSLKKYGLTPIIIEDYSDIPEILKEVKRRYLQHTVFISGAIGHYDAPWTKERVSEFVTALSRRLAKDYNVMTGFGLGVGSDIINGALQTFEDEKIRNWANRLIMRPFPQFDEKTPDAVRQSRWKEYRMAFLSGAGTSIFLFGNKKVADNVIISNGMLQEYEIASEKNHIIIPVGVTGYAAEDIWEKESSKWDESIKPKYEVLNTSYADDELINTIVGILEYELNRCK